MNKPFIALLTDFIDVNGKKILDQPDRFKSLFLDFTQNQYRAEVQIFSQFLASKQAQELKNADDVDASFLKALSGRFHQDYLFDKSACELTVKAYAWFLGLIDKKTFEVWVGGDVKPEAVEEQQEQPISAPLMQDHPINTSTRFLGLIDKKTFEVWVGGDVKPEAVEEQQEQPVSAPLMQDHPVNTSTRNPAGIQWGKLIITLLIIAGMGFAIYSIYKASVAKQQSKANYLCHESESLQPPEARVPQIYITGHDGDFAVFWYNDAAVVLPKHTDSASASGIAVSNSDVYTTGHDGRDAVYWRNGTRFVLPKDNEYAYASAIFIKP